MPRIPNELFLLMINLSQLDSEDIIKEIFLEAISDWTNDKNIRLHADNKNNFGSIIEIKTNSNSFGVISFTADDLSEDDIFILRNAISTLAVILESLRNKNAIEQEKKRLETLVHKRTEELREINEELMSEIMQRELYEERLIENELKYRDLVENINDVIVTIDSESIVTYISPLIHNISGYSPQEIVGLKYTLFIHIDDRKRIQKNFKGTGKDEVFVSRFRIIDKNKKILWLRCSLKIIIENRIFKGVKGILTDITELKERDDRLELIAMHIDEVLWIIDSKKNTLTYISPSFERVWGYSSKVLYENYGLFLDSIHPDDRKTIKNSLKNVMSTGLFDGECRIVRPDGEIRWMWVKIFPLRDSEGIIINSIGIARDITEKRQNELRYSAIIRTSMFGFFLIDTNANILEVNDSACSMIGYSKEEFIGMKISSIEAIFRHEMFVEILRDVNSRGWSRMESRIKCKDGSSIDVDISVSNLQTEMDRFVIFIRDITEKKILEEQVIKAQKMESIGRLSAGIAHDFNNLLSPILGYTEMMMLSSKTESTQIPMLDEIKKAAERSRELIKQLMAFSRKQFIETKTSSFQSIVDAFRMILRRTLRENIEIQIIHNAPYSSIIVDEGKIEQIIMNLSLNAQDSMPAGGKIVIETGSIFLDAVEASMISSLVPGRYATLSVSDTGIGMDKETLSKIFEPFYTTKEDGRGTGLGLASVYGIASQHLGSVAVYSEVNKGSTFIVYIPQREDSVIENNIMSHDEDINVVSDSGVTVLVAEDEEITSKVVLQILTNLGYNTISASNGTECIVMMENDDLASKVSLLLSDVILNDMNGPELYIKLKERNPELKAVFMSGYAAESIHTYALNKEDFEFIQKPFTVKDLDSKLKIVLNKTEHATSTFLF